MFKSTFWGIMKKGEWDRYEEPLRILEPIIAYLAGESDKVIFGFDDVMSELLYNLDREKIARPCIENGDFDDEKFLYQRCVVLTLTNKYYSDVINGYKQLDPELEFKAILKIPARAWARKNNSTMMHYPHTPKYSIKTKSNKKYW